MFVYYSTSLILIFTEIRFYNKLNYDLKCNKIEKTKQNCLNGSVCRKARYGDIIELYCQCTDVNLLFLIQNSI